MRSGIYWLNRLNERSGAVAVYNDAVANQCAN